MSDVPPADDDEPTVEWPPPGLDPDTEPSHPEATPEDE
jgi:hypothetical protein